MTRVAISSTVAAATIYVSDYIGLIRALRVLLESGANPNMVDSKEVSPFDGFCGAVKLHWRDKKDKICRLKEIHDILIEFGANPNYVNLGGRPYFSQEQRDLLGIVCPTYD